MNSRANARLFTHFPGVSDFGVIWRSTAKSHQNRYLFTEWRTRINNKGARIESCASVENLRDSEEAAPVMLHHHPCPFGVELPANGQPATFQRSAGAGSFLPESFGDNSAICCLGTMSCVSTLCYVIALAPSVLIQQKSLDSGSSRLLLDW